MNFDKFFRQATGHGPYPYQTRLAEGNANEFPQLLDIPTGLGWSRDWLLTLRLVQRGFGDTSGNLPARSCTMYALV